MALYFKRVSNFVGLQNLKVHCTRSAKGIAKKLKNPSCTKVKFSYKCYHGIAHWLEINQQSIGIVQQFLAGLRQEFCAMLFIMS